MSAIIRYNMPALLKTFKGDGRNILYHLERRIKGKLLSNLDTYAVAGPLPSFLLEDEAYICYNSKTNKKLIKNTTIDERIVYLYLAGKRDYLEYTTKGIKTIPIEFADLPVHKLRLNKLLEIKNGLIYFKNVPTE